MNEGLIIIGAIILAASIFGYAYSGEQQGALDQAEEAISGEGQDWELIQSVSLAGIALGAVILVVGLIPEDWYNDSL